MARKPAARGADATLDVAIIGAGHNGLVAAAYLAGAGLSVGVFERRAVVGGAAVTEEFAPGFRNSTASYTVSLLHPKVIRELRLAEHGLRIVPRPMQNFLPLPGGDWLCAPAQLEALRVQVARHSERDADRLPHWQAFIAEAAEVLRALMLHTPPSDLAHWPDLWALLKWSRRLRRLPLAQQRSIHELFTRSAGDVLDGWFESSALKALYGFDAVVGNYASPYTPGSAYVLLHHAIGEVNGRRGIWGHALGGMGAITQAMAAEARARGALIETGAGVERVWIEDGRARGLTLYGGRRIRAHIVAANVNPRLLYLQMVEPQHLPGDFIASMQRYRCASATFRMNVALSELPRFDATPPAAHAAGAQDHLSSGIILAPSLEYMDHAHAQARLQGHSSAPIIEMVIPSTMDDSLAPRGAHVASLFCQHFAPQLPHGGSWESAREPMARLIIDTVTQYAPNFARAVIAYSALSPADLEQRFGLIGGDIFHGALGLDQLWAARPVLGYGDYRSPVPGLYLCGAGAHPGGGVTGLPGHNAARRMLQDWRARRSPMVRRHLR
ncbi:MAG: phytoene desaturase family protein [Steroidobacteraceae bacterium]